MELKPFPPLSDALIEALEQRFPDRCPTLETGSAPTSDILQAMGAVALQHQGRREVIQALRAEREKQLQKSREK